MSRLTSFVLGYHGCDRAIGEQALSGDLGILQSTRDFDWLGAGAYFCGLLGIGFAAGESIHGIGVRRESTQQDPANQCTESNECSQQSLHANVRAANANEDAVDVAVWQLVLGAVGICGVGVTIFYAHYAWRAAQASADAANDALEHTRTDAAEQAERFGQQLAIAQRQLSDTQETAQQQLRAYLHVDKLTLIWGPDGHPLFNAVVTNSGQTPAPAVVIGAQAYLGSPHDLATKAVPRGFVLGRWPPVGANRDTSSGLLADGQTNITTSAISSDSILCVHGRVIYRDVFGKLWETEFSFFTTGPLPTQGGLAITPGTRPAYQLAAQQNEGWPPLHAPPDPVT